MYSIFMVGYAYVRKLPYLRLIVNTIRPERQPHKREHTDGLYSFCSCKYLEPNTLTVAFELIVRRLSLMLVLIWFSNYPEVPE